jgi:FkbM family methyltransferase
MTEPAPEIRPVAFNPTFVSYAQNGEDILLHRIFGGMTSGFFVDVGAGDPIVHSVTYSLYLRGWSGVNIEPVPEVADALRRVRPRDQTVQCAAGRSAATATLSVAQGTGLSTISEAARSAARDKGIQFESIDVQVRTLDQILDDEIGSANTVDIHMLKIDVEGHEADVLAGLSLDRWRPWVLIVEATRPLETRRSAGEWHQTVISQGYTFGFFDGLNNIYIHNARTELAEQLSYPVCVFDEPFQKAEATLAVERHWTEDTFERIRLTEETRRLGSELSRVTAESTMLSEILGGTERLVNQLAEFNRRQDSTTLSLVRLQAEVDELRSSATTVDTLRAELEVERLRFQQLSHSLSWRITSPLRSIRRRVG